MTPKQKALKIIRFLKREMSKETTVQTKVADGINSFISSIQSVTPEFKDFKISKDRMWENSSGKWNAYAKCIEKIEKEFGI